jgi:predicted nuclease of predicted toxin-antitoxin system
LRFLIDQNLPTRLIGVLHELGHDADHVKLLKLDMASDGHIWTLAASLPAVVISKDRDFLSLVRRETSTGFVHLDVGNLSNDQLFAIVRRTWPIVTARLQAGERLVEIRP